jgi:RNA polymerase sigma factor (TIGR02999 family)
MVLAAARPPFREARRALRAGNARRPMSEPDNATRWLSLAADGDSRAAGRLLELLYSELKSVANSILAEERRGHTLQPTALVHEAYLRLVGNSLDGVEGKHQFVRVAARAMRNIVIDHARARRREKRGGDAARVPLDDFVDAFSAGSVDLLALDDAIQQLAAADPQLGEIVELRFFAGLTIEETARSLGVSTATVERGWRMARSWLHRGLQ